VACQILIASPSRSEREMMASILSEAGHITDVIPSIEEAMRVEDSGKYDLAIIDADFGAQGQGWLLAKQLRHSHWGKNLGIIILTRSSPMGFMHDTEYRDLYDQVLFFPVGVEELLANVERVMRFRKKR